MEITRVQKEQGVSLLKVVVGEADYKEAVEKMLHDYKRKANIPGFRPGMVPMGIVRKMYGKGIVAEQSYRTASNAVFEYLQKENIDYIGDVIPAEEQGAFDFDNSTEFEFMFEIGEAPKYEVELTSKDKLTYHKIKISKDMHKNFLDNFLRRFGKLVEVDKVKKDEALTVTLDNGELRVEDAYVGLISMSDEERNALLEQYKHPIIKEVGEVAKKVGGHGGMDFVMDYRLIYCLRNGLPLDMNVYDAALWSCLVELTDTSANSGGAPVEIPDFTRGKWMHREPVVRSKYCLDEVVVDESVKIFDDEE